MSGVENGRPPRAPVNAHGVQLDRIKIGDRIRFRSVTRYNSAAVWRVVTHTPAVTLGGHHFGVNFEGCRPFFVRSGEILEHVERDVPDLVDDILGGGYKLRKRGAVTYRAQYEETRFLVLGLNWYAARFRLRNSETGETLIVKLSVDSLDNHSELIAEETQP